ncbi:discoidin domain-containing protein [Streptosporangium roseum]|uniref:discoidin domain-containing protein n=1 Tax=Streptosporangium roseum TaxID=2001 RepID=UPI000A79006D|nr:discoidin domain-containing protein [Streptosporangium roseum]
MIGSWVRKGLVAALVMAMAAGGGASAVAAVSERAAPQRAAPQPAGALAPTALGGYRIQSSAKTADSGAAISTPGYAATGWYPAGPRSTVLAALLENKVYPDPFYSTNMKNIPAADFAVPWWYRSDFTLGAESGLNTFLDFTGLVSGGDVWVNGTRVATGLAGAYPRHQIDVSSLVHPGVNTVAFKVNPNDPNKNLTIGWIDWVQTPPDKNMGIFRDVSVRRSGSVALRDAHVVTSLTAALDRADLTIKVDARNDSSSPVTATVSGTAGPATFTQEVALAAHQTKTVTFTRTIDGPQVWWPYGMGAQPLHDLDLTATVGGTVTDASHSTFGIRSVTSSLDGSGHRLYRINGRPLLIRGGGWSPDLFLRYDPVYAENKLRYVRDLGLNTIRLEGHLEPDGLLDLTDRMGILVMAGWECCNKWEGHTNGGESGDTWTAADFPVAKASMAAEAARLRDHPSVFTFLIGSDFAPDAQQESGYLDAIGAADWNVPVVAAASDKSSPQLGSSGMKMTGPYDWVPPSYWYAKREGGAYGFNSETGAGPDVPTLDSLKRMMSASELNTLWQNLGATQYHRSPSKTFDNLKIFNNAMVGRYGTPTSLDDYVRKAQLAQYEATRAQFEAYGRNFKDASNPSTGVVYWMLNSGWSSLHWQLFDTYLDQGGSYWGTRKANAPLHVQYSYDNRSVVVVNSTHAAAPGLTVKTDVYNLDGTSKYTDTTTVTAPADGGKVTAVTIPAITGLSSTYLVRLTLSDASGEIDRNVYWLSTSADVIDWANNDWYYVPTTSYADLKGLTGMAQAPLSVTAATPSAGTTTVTVTNTGTGKIPAFYLDAHVVNAAGRPVLPIRWSDNAISLWPGESKTLTATYHAADLNGSAPSVRVTGWNTATQTVPAGGGGGPDTQAPSVPGNLRSTAVTPSSVTLTWDASTDNVGVSGYDVHNGPAVAATVTGTGATVTGLAAATPYTFTVRARDAAGNASAASAAVTVTTSPASTETLLSQGRPATASSTEGSAYGAAKAFDGNTTSTRWASAEGHDPEWLRVDLGSVKDVTRVKLFWEAAYGKAYQVQVSADGSAWTTVYSTTTGDGGGDDLTGLSGSGRYVRINGTARGTAYGYSLYEMQVYGR